MKVNFSITLPERRTRYVLVGGGFLFGLFGFMAVAWAGVPNIFKDGDVLTAQALNDNFAAAGDPPGTIVAYGGDPTKLPAGWLACDGAPVSRTDFAGLFGAIGTTWGTADSQHFNVPDLRGRFLRGLSTTSANDPDCVSRAVSNPGGVTGCAVGTLQGDQFASHIHSTSLYQAGTTSGANMLDVFASTSQNGGLVPFTSAPSGGTETRPKNAAVIFIIKE